MNKVYALIAIYAPDGHLQAIKEDLAMYCEKHGDCKVVSITEQKPEQMEMAGFGK